MGSSDKILIDQLIRMEASAESFRLECYKTRKLIEKAAGVSTPSKDRQRKVSKLASSYTERVMRRIARNSAI